jgi:hypothetical protein
MSWPADQTFIGVWVLRITARTPSRSKCTRALSSSVTVAAPRALRFA